MRLVWLSCGWVLNSVCLGEKKSYNLKVVYNVPATE